MLLILRILSLIHDGARPFVKKELITTLINKVSSGFGIIPTINTTNSIRIKEGDNLKAINRDSVFKVQTPQCFLFNEILNSYKIDYDEIFTDDASVFESKQGKIKNVSGSYNNIKNYYTSRFRVSTTFNKTSNSKLFFEP